MTRLRIQYAPAAEIARHAMHPDLRRRFEHSMRALARDPYGQGTRDVKGEKDRRQGVAGGAVIVYYVSAAVLVVTVVRIVHA
jgi:plasmid stabilization system protein ParE